MKSSLRRFAAIAAFAVCLYLCDCLYSGEVIVAASSSAGPDTVASGIKAPPPRTVNRVVIPGPLRSFLRMAGISQQIRPDEVLPLLARNSYLLGYNESTQTEFMRLLNRYLHQARELQVLAGTTGTIHIANCNDAATLLRVLGYRLREACGQPSLSLETTNATRAFLTIDSGFPLTQLEEALQKDAPFDYPFPVSSVPVLFNESDWLALSAVPRGSYGSVVDVLANDPGVARLYWALSKNDAETSLALQQSPGLKRLLPYAATLDFYGSQVSIRSGRVLVPGSASAEQSWKELAGANPDSPGEFVTHLLEKDNGWLAAYFDAVSRSGKAQQDYLTAGPRLRLLYDAFRSPGDQFPAARGVFPKAPDLVVLFTRLSWEPSGEIRVPGGLDVWKQILRQNADSESARSWAGRARTWDRPEQLLEPMTALSRSETDSGPLQMYLLLSELDSGRPQQRRLSAATVRLLTSQFSQLSSWYLIFS